MQIKNGLLIWLDLSQLRGTTWWKWEGFSFPPILFACKVSASSLLHWVGLKLHSTLWKKIEFTTSQLPYFGRKKEFRGSLPPNYCKPRSFLIFRPGIKKSKGLGKSKFKENLKGSKTTACIWLLGDSHCMDSFNRQVTSTGWELRAGYQWLGKCSNRHQPQGTLLLPSR